MVRAVASKTNSSLVTELSLICMSGEAYYFISLKGEWKLEVFWGWEKTDARKTHLNLQGGTQLAIVSVEPELAIFCVFPHYGCAPTFSIEGKHTYKTLLNFSMCFLTVIMIFVNIMKR